MLSNIFSSNNKNKIRLQWSESVSCSVVSFSSPGSSVHGISQARILGWVAISSPRGSSQPRNRTQVSHVSCIGGADSLPLAPLEKPVVVVHLSETLFLLRTSACCSENLALEYASCLFIAFILQFTSTAEQCS